MKIREIKENKKQYLKLLLLGDEQENMIDLYLEKGTMYILEDQGALAECVVLDAGDGVLEIKNIAVEPTARGKGYGRAMIRFLAETYRGQYGALLAGTGESPLTLPFYEKCGFVFSHRIKDFFIKNYDHPIIEGGVELKDMVYLKRRI